MRRDIPGLQGPLGLRPEGGRALGEDLAAADDLRLPGRAVLRGDLREVVEVVDKDVLERGDAGIDVARISGQVKASSIKKISEVVASHPDESVAIIRSWLAEEPADRAA